MRKIVLLVLAVTTLAACGIIGGGDQEQETQDFCQRAQTAFDAGVLATVDGTETPDQLRAYETAQPAVDYIADHHPDKIDQASKDFVAAYDELVTALSTAGFDATQIPAATLTDLSQRMDAALADMTAPLANQCNIDLPA